MSDDSTQNGSVSFLFKLAAAAAGLAVVAGTVGYLIFGQTINSREVAVVESFGKVTDVVHAGAHWKWPWESFYKYPVGVVVADDVTINALTKDSQKMAAVCSVHYSLPAVEKPQDLTKMHVSFSSKKDDKGSDSPVNALYDNIIRRFTIGAMGKVISDGDILDNINYEKFGQKVANQLITDINTAGYTFKIDKIIVSTITPDPEATKFANTIALEKQRKQLIDLRATNADLEKATKEKEADAQAAGSIALFNKEATAITKYATDNHLPLNSSLQLYQNIKTYDILAKQNKLDIVIGTNGTLSITPSGGPH